MVVFDSKTALEVCYSQPLWQFSEPPDRSKSFPASWELEHLRMQTQTSQETNLDLEQISQLFHAIADLSLRAAPFETWM